MDSKFIVHHHRAAKPHFDLRVVLEGLLRSWSLFKEPPLRPGEPRLAIERESFAAEDMHRGTFREDAFGEGRVSTWDEGNVEIFAVSPKHFVLVFMGKRLSGRYELRRMRWYPGNRWLLRKERSTRGDLA